MHRLSCLQNHLIPLDSSLASSSSSVPVSTSDKGSFEETRAAEKQRCVWKVEELELIVDRNPSDRELQRRAFEIVLKEPLFEATDLDQFEKSTPERREQSTRRLFRFSQLVKGKSEEEEFALIRALSCVDSGTAIRWFVQRLLWIETIRNQGSCSWGGFVHKFYLQKGSAEQIEKWTNGARDYAIVGCFGMTEMASSSHLRGAETEAVYNHATRTFRINSPTVWTRSSFFFFFLSFLFSSHKFFFVFFR